MGTGDVEIMRVSRDKRRMESLGGLETRAVTPAVGGFATFADAFPRPAAIERLFALQAVARFNFVNAFRFRFCCDFGHNHTVGYGSVRVNDLLINIADL